MISGLEHAETHLDARIQSAHLNLKAFKKKICTYIDDVIDSNTVRQSLVFAFLKNLRWC